MTAPNPLPQTAQDEHSRPRFEIQPAAADKRLEPPSTSEQSIGGVANSLISELRSVIGFGWSFGMTHPEWAHLDARRRMLPERLSQPLFELDDAQCEHRWIGHEHQEARQGIAYGERQTRLEAARAISHAKGTEVLAEIQAEIAVEHHAALERLGRAKALANELAPATAHALDEIDRRLLRDWMAEHRVGVQTLHDLLADWLKRVRIHIDGLAIGASQEFGGRVSGTACEILLDIAHDALELMNPGEASSKESFDKMHLDWEAWEKLRISVRNEIAKVVTMQQLEEPRHTASQKHGMEGPPRLASGVDIPPRPRTTPILTGWNEILPPIGLEPKQRKHKDLVRDLNSKRSGPIHWISRNRPAVDLEALTRWWSGIVEQVEERASDEAAARRHAHEHPLENAGVRKEQGYHLKSSPNKLRRGA